MQEVLTYMMNTFGYLGVCFLIAIENIFPPIPSEVILTFGGFMTTYTRLTVPGVIVFSTIGSLIEALILYRVGLELNRERLGRVMESRMFQRLGFEKSDVEKTIAAFDKHGKKAVLFGRCIPIIRSLVSVPAGMAEMKLSVFLFYTTIGSTVWNILLVSLGAALGASWEKILFYLDRYSGAVRLLFWGAGQSLCGCSEEEKIVRFFNQLPQGCKSVVIIPIMVKNHDSYNKQLVLFIQIHTGDIELSDIAENDSAYYCHRYRFF